MVLLLTVREEWLCFLGFSIYAILAILTLPDLEAVLSGYGIPSVLSGKALRRLDRFHLKPC
jgi:branched-subunit amino acid transport protein AzlD